MFLAGLELMKEEGIRPCCINIADSTGSFFSGHHYNAVFTNQYTPKYFVPLLHNKLLHGLKQLYGDSII